MLSILHASYKEDYTISLHFSDNKKGEVDLKNFIFNTPIKSFRQLQDMNKFRDFKVQYTLKWGDTLDLAPEYLYFKAFEKDERLQEKFRAWGYI